MAILSGLLDAYSLIVLAAVVCSWLRVGPHHPLLRVTRALTEPALAPIRRLLPTGGGIDISPLVLLLALRLLKRLVLA